MDIASFGVDADRREKALSELANEIGTKQTVPHKFTALLLQGMCIMCWSDQNSSTQRDEPVEKVFWLDCTNKPMLCFDVAKTHKFEGNTTGE